MGFHLAKWSKAGVNWLDPLWSDTEQALLVIRLVKSVNRRLIAGEFPHVFFIVRSNKSSHWILENLSGYNYNRFVTTLFYGSRERLYFIFYICYFYLFVILLLLT